MEREARFQEMLKDLCMLARVNKNTVTRQLVEEFFEELQLSKEQMKHIYAYLKEQKIQVLQEGAVKKNPNGEEAVQDAAQEAQNTQNNALQGTGAKGIDEDREFDEQIEQLCQEVIKGDNSKKQEILEAYQPKMRQYVKGFLKSGLLEEDLLQEAGLGLLLALESLTVKSEELSFAQYLETGIENEIRRALEEEYQAEKADEELEKKVNQFHRRLVELGEELERKPTIEEVCMYMKLSAEEVDYYFRLMGDGAQE